MIKIVINKTLRLVNSKCLSFDTFRNKTGIQTHRIRWGKPTKITIKNVIDLFVKLVRNIEILQMIFETKRE